MGPVIRFIAALAVVVAPIFLPTTAGAQRGQIETQMTQRGLMDVLRIGDLTVSYVTGRTAGAGMPVFDMSLGEIAVENTGQRPINLKYDSRQTFSTGHTFVFGARRQNKYVFPRSETYDPPGAVDVDLPPGRKILIGRQDLMELFSQAGRAYFLDGTICTSFEAMLLVDGRPQILAFGPHCFTVAMQRDWKAEQERYLAFFLARDKG